MRGYLKRAFGDDLRDVEAAMGELAAAYGKEDIGGNAYRLYENFRYADCANMPCHLGDSIPFAQRSDVAVHTLTGRRSRTAQGAGAPRQTWCVGTERAAGLFTRMWQHHACNHRALVIAHRNKQLVTSQRLCSINVQDLGLLRALAHQHQQGS